MSWAALRVGWSCFGLVKPIRLVQSKERRSHTVGGICHFWRFPLNLLIPPCFPSCRSSGDFWVAGGEVLQQAELICWFGFPVWLWDGVTRNTRSLCSGRAVPWVCDWDLWTLQASPMRTDAVPPHFKRIAFAALVAAACTYPTSSYLSHPGAFPKSAGAHPTPFPTLLLALLIPSVSLLFV